VKIETVEFIRSAHRAGDFPRDGKPQVAFVGRSNVGKSSLLNRLLGRRRMARVSSTPGRTRAVNLFLINGRLIFADLPGYGYAKVSKQERRRWADLMERYFTAAMPGAILVLVVDAKVGATALDIQAAEYLHSLGAEIVIAATKTDRLKRSERDSALGAIRRSLNLAENTEPIPFSARTGEGVSNLWRELEDRLRVNAA
jgi:GTP-binding protein